MRIYSAHVSAIQPDCPISEGTIRRMIKCGECPGFYQGSRFYVNFEELLAVLKRKSLATIGEATNEE